MPAIIDSIKLLFDTSEFPARWNCGSWTPLHGWVHIITDLAIASAYAMIPFAIARYCWVKRSELAFPRVFWLFAAFIFSCGGVHFVEAVIYYHPVYRFSALIKVITAIVSWATVIAIIRIAPKALELPGLRRANADLQNQLEITRSMSEALQVRNQDLREFTGTVAHDLRNPMSGALFMAELAKESSDAGNTELAATQLQIVLDSLRQMDRFVGELHTKSTGEMN